MIIALAGQAGSGKDTVATMIAEFRRDTRAFSFAEPLKRFAMEVFDWSEEQVFGASHLRNEPDPRYRRANGELLTPRHALQTLGTEWGRSCFENIWADLGVRRAMAHTGLAVITDCRFQNEAQAVRAAGGQVWKVIRPGAGLRGGAGAHASEMEQDSPEFSALVTARVANSGTLNELREQVRALLTNL